MSSVFPDTRLRRAGANRAEVKAAGEYWSGLDEDGQAAFVKEIASLKDPDVKALVEDLVVAPGTVYGADLDDQGDGQGDGDGGGDGDPQLGQFDEALKTVESAKDHAEAHPEDVAALLDAELAGKGRTTLVAHLGDLLRPKDDGQGDGDGGGDGSE